jgi:hypothetical protein
LAKRQARIRAQLRALRGRAALWRQSAHIEVLAEQKPWLTVEEQQLRELQTEVDQLERQLGEHEGGLAIPIDPNRRTTAAPNATDLARLRPLVAPWREARRRYRAARQSEAAERETAKALAAEIHAALSDRQEKELTEALESAGQLVSRLRRRVQVDERIAQLKAHHEELEERSQSLSERQMLPAWILAALGAVFVVGAVLVLSGLLLPPPARNSLSSWTCS